MDTLVMMRLIDSKTFMEKVYEESHKKIFDFLYKYTNNPEIAMDLMQETFYNFYRSYGNQDMSNEKAIMLLYTIARNNSINYSKKFSTVKEKNSDVEAYESGKVSFEKKQELKDMEQKLQECLEFLPEDQKTAIILKNMQDMTLEQISGVMEVSISTVSRLVVKATASLLNLAEKHGINPY